MDHCLTEIFRSGTAVGVTLCDFMRNTVALHHGGIADRNIFGTLLDVGHGVSAIGHHAIDQAICIGHGARGIIDEATLHCSPFHGKGFAVHGCELAKGECFHSLFALNQCCLGTAGVTLLLVEGTVVLRTEAALQLLTPAAATCDHSHGDDSEHSDNDE